MKSKPSTGGSKGSSSNSNSNPKSTTSSITASSTLSKSKSKSKSKPSASKPSLAGSKRRRKLPNYTDAQLKLPTLNSIIPSGVRKPTSGKKKGKKFVENPQQLKQILELVNDIKDGQIKVKSEQAAYLEALKSARDEEARRKEEEKGKRLEDGKRDLKDRRKWRKGKIGAAGGLAGGSSGGREGGGSDRKKTKGKKVSFDV